ncbi:MAG: hypothetical protein JKY12_01995 [Sneathiella sp.]|nr:hypothetical protein [Sneathiella sp.]
MSNVADPNSGVTTNNPSESDGKISPAKSKSSGVVQHHEIGEMAHFLSAFGKNKDNAVKTLIASSLQIVGLEEVKKKYSGRWEQISHRVEQAIDAFFTKKLKNGDTFVRLGEGQFALIFINLTREEGQAKAMTLARELIKLLFGEMPGVDMISVETMVIDVNMAGSIEDFGSLEDLISHFQKAIKEAEKKEAVQIKEAENELVVQFRSMINHGKKIISVTEVVPCRKTGKDVSLLLKSDAMLNGSPHLRAELDLLILKEAGLAISKLGALGNKPIVFITVSLETLANASSRRKYAEMMKGLPVYTRKHLILNIEGIELGTPNSRYRQILTSVRQLVLGFSFEIDKTWDDFDVISDLPIVAISVASNNSPDLAWIEDLRERTKRAGLKFIWRDLKKDELARWAFRLGADYVSGSVIGALQMAPARPFSIKGALS